MMGNFGRVAALLADPAPVAAGLFTRDAALFQQNDLLTVAGQKQRCANADDTAADDHNICLIAGAGRDR